MMKKGSLLGSKSDAGVGGDTGDQKSRVLLRYPSASPWTSISPSLKLK